MKIEVLTYKCTKECGNKVSLYFANEKTSVICGRCGKWMCFSDELEVEAKVRGKHGGDIALEVLR